MADGDDEETRGTEDAPNSVIREASEAALEQLGERLKEEGGKLLCGFVVVLAEGVRPNGGVFYMADEDDGPESSEEVLSIALSGIGSFAEAIGQPMAVMEMPNSSPPGGQG